MNKVIYVKADSPKKITNQIASLDILQIIADQDQEGIKGFYIFYREPEPTQMTLPIQELTPEIEITEGIPEKEVIKTQEEVFEEIRRRDEERVKEYDEQTAKTREQEREMWQKRMQRIQANASLKKDE